MSLPKVVKSLSWMDVTNLLSLRNSNQSTLSQRERDVGDSFHPQQQELVKERPEQNGEGEMYENFRN